MRSTSHYKRYKNTLLSQLEEHYTEVKIDSISIPNVTVADDLAVLARRFCDMQVILWDVEDNTSLTENPTKSSRLCYNNIVYMSKPEWKRILTQAVHGHIEAMWIAEV